MTGNFMIVLQALLGIFCFLLLAWGISEDRRRVRLKPIAIGLLIQFVLAVLLLKVAIIQDAFHLINEFVLLLSQATKEGSQFVFGYLGGSEAPFMSSGAGSSFIMAFQALPIILVISALSALLFYWGILPMVVKVIARLFEKLLGIRASLSLGCAANIFVGMVEAPLFIKQYIAQMGRGELFILMTTGMATVAGTVLVFYASLMSTYLPDALSHLLIASIISAPAAIIIAMVMVPQGCRPSEDESKLELKSPYSSSMDAITQGTTDGVKLLINIMALLLVLVALVSLANQVLALLPDINGEAVSLQGLLGYLMAPVAWLIGIPWEQATAAGQLMGVKVVLNELLAYIQLSQMESGVLSSSSVLIMTYALCGFANFGSLGIMLGGLTTMVPERRQEIIGLGMKSILSGNLASFMTGAVIAIVY